MKKIKIITSSSPETFQANVNIFIEEVKGSAAITKIKCKVLTTNVNFTPFFVAIIQYRPFSSPKN